MKSIFDVFNSPFPESGEKVRKLGFLLSSFILHPSSFRQEEFATYYNRPVLKKPHWIWQIWLYFWLGGIGGGCAVISMLAKLFGDKKRVKPIVRAAHYISLATGMAAPLLLVMDLGRPERFLHMLRVLKLRSPLSVGTYIMSGNALFASLVFARQLVEDGLIPAKSLLGKAATLVPGGLVTGLQGAAGFGMGTYTGVLISSTAIPLWSEATEILPPLFLSSGLSNASAALQLVLLASGLDEDTADYKALESIETAALLTELALLGFGRWNMGALLTKPLTEGRVGKLFLGGAVGGGLVLPLLLQRVGHTRWLRAIGAVATLLGGLTMRYCIVEGGKLSADDPQAYHSITRKSGVRH